MKTLMIALTALLSLAAHAADHLRVFALPDGSRIAIESDEAARRVGLYHITQAREVTTLPFSEMTVGGSTTFYWLDDGRLLIIPFASDEAEKPRLQSAGTVTQRTPARPLTLQLSVTERSPHDMELIGKSPHYLDGPDVTNVSLRAPDGGRYLVQTATDIVEHAEGTMVFHIGANGDKVEPLKVADVVLGFSNLLFHLHSGATLNLPSLTNLAEEPTITFPPASITPGGYSGGTSVELEEIAPGRKHVELITAFKNNPANACAEGLTPAAQLTAEQIFEVFYRFTQRLPAALRAQIESFGPGHGFASKEEMEQIGQSRPTFSFIVRANEHDAAFAQDDAVTEPSLVNGKVLLPRTMGRYRVWLGFYTPH